MRATFHAATYEPQDKYYLKYELRAVETGGDCLAGSKGLLITPSPGVTRSIDP